MRRIVLDKNKLHEGALILVNRDYPVDGTLQTPHLFPFQRGEESLGRRTAYAFTSLLHELGGGRRIKLTSGYRTRRVQESIFEECMAEKGPEFTRKYVALPGHSEHQTGLAFDVGLSGSEMGEITPAFPYDEGICRAFREKAKHFGIIERYSRGKEAITGIAHEPWHFRYVGTPHAEFMEEHNLSLEEYMALLKGYHFEDSPLCYRGAEISYIPIEEDSSMIHLPEDARYNFSGNNSDGFILTLWRK